MRKFLIIFPSLLLFSSFLFGEINQDSNPNCVITPSARTCQNSYGVYVTGDFIYWKARQNELIFAAKAKISPMGTGINVSLKPIELDFEYDPGFKLGLGGNLPWDGWDVYLNWTHFHTTAKVTTTSATPNIVDLDVVNEDVVQFAGKRFTESWNLMFNSLDFDWGRRFYLSETLTVRPSFGAKANWFRHKIRFNISEVELVNFPGFTALPRTFSSRGSYSGVGPYAAFQAKWGFGWGLGLFGQASTAILWGRLKSVNDQDFNGLQGGGPNTSQNVVHLPFNTYRLRPTAQLLIALDWEWCCIEKWLSVNLRLGYETQIFWSQFVNVVDGIQESDLTFEGLTFSARLDF